MADPGWYREIEEALGRAPVAHAPLSGGCIAQVCRIDMADGATLVVKRTAQGALELEGWMLTYLATHSTLPVPAVHHASNQLLIMDYIAAGDAIGGAAEVHAAELLARLHGVTAPEFGLERDTVIATIAQPNPRGTDWIAFFRDHRLLYMARTCLESGRIGKALMGRIENLATRLDELLGEPGPPALIHGDMWAGNVLVADGRVTGFVDPAIYYADAEIELAFGTLFATFGDAFFARYRELRPIRPGFFAVRRDIYNLWHLLNHVQLFGASYLSGVERVLVRHGL